MNRPNSEPQWQAAADAIFAAETILVTSHVAPDGDAVGSLLGISETMRALGKSVTPVIDDGVPAGLSFLPESQTILPKIDSGEFDLMIATDSSDLERIGAAGTYGMAHSRQVINLDHHATNTLYGDIQVVAPQAVAAAEVAFDLIAVLGCGYSESAAYALLTGLVTDTQGFRISATNSRTMEIAQALMRRGASLSRIMAQTLNRRPYQEVELWKYVLPSVHLDNGLIYADITQEDIARAGLKTMTDGDLVSHLVNVDGAAVSVIFKELPENQIEISFRSKPGFDVASVALELGGGGHKQASGCKLGGTLPDVRLRVLSIVRQAIAKGRASLA